MKSLLEASLKLLVKQLCNSIDDVSINIDASITEILKGNIKSITLKSKKLNYKDLLINSLFIRCRNVNLKLESKVGLPKVKVNQAFKIAGKMVFSSIGLKQMMNSEKWSFIVSNLLLLSSKEWEVHNLNIKGTNELDIEMKNKFSEDLINIYSLNLSTEDGKLLIHNKHLDIKEILPADQSFIIEEYKIYNQLFELNFNSEVTI